MRGGAARAARESPWRGSPGLEGLAPSSSPSRSPGEDAAVRHPLDAEAGDRQRSERPSPRTRVAARSDSETATAARGGLGANAPPT